MEIRNETELRAALQKLDGFFSGADVTNAQNDEARSICDAIILFCKEDGTPIPADILTELDNVGRQTALCALAFKVREFLT